MLNIDYETLCLIVVLELKLYESQIFVFFFKENVHIRIYIILTSFLYFLHLGPIITIDFQNFTFGVVRFKIGKMK